MLTVFQSTHPHGVRRHCKNFRFSKFKFQSTHPHGVRRYSVSYFKVVLMVSIHAPTRGATIPGINYLIIWMFQSTHPHGVRQSTLILSTVGTKFQSTHPHGVRQQETTLSPGTYICFNPRTHTGCDFVVILFNRRIVVSIHAPTRGATLFACRSC